MQKKELYRRGEYYLACDFKNDGTPRSKNLYIFWYDRSAGRLRSRSTGTASALEGKERLDRLYDEQVSDCKFCPTCGQSFAGYRSPLVAEAIGEYVKATNYKAAEPRLEHILDYLEAKSLESTRADDVDDYFINGFRMWAASIPIISPKGLARPRTSGTIEGSVRQLRAAINFAFKARKLPHVADFEVKSANEVSRSPWFRADEAQLVQMFRHALVLDHPDTATKKQLIKWKRERKELLNFLRLSVATWARPDAVFDFSTAPQRDQWQSHVGYINLNPKGRAQTKKYRPLIPASRQMVALLDANEGPFIKVKSVRTAFRQMVATLDFPVDGQSGMKLIRRSVSTLLRPFLDDSGQWHQGRMMMGHVKPNESDKYATPYHPKYMSHALSATEALIDRIERAAPGAFS